MENGQFERLAQYFIRLVRYGLKMDGDRPQKPTDVAWRDVSAIAARQNLCILAYLALKDADDKPDGEAWKRIEDGYQVGLIADVHQGFAFEELKAAFAQKKIDILPLKGLSMKALYPAPELREMGDLDILYPQSRREDVLALMAELGYALLHDGQKEHHDEYFRPPTSHVEMHHGLVNLDSYYVDYYSEPWARAKKTQTDGVFAFSKEDEYVFLLLHAAKHYQNGGVGIRTVIDFYFFLKKYSGQMDWAYIDAEIQKADELAQKAGAKPNSAKHVQESLFALMKDWFDGAEPTLTPAGLFIVSGGVYGSTEWAWKNSAEKAGGKTKYLLSRLFPSYEWFKKHYPTTKKWPILVPFFWVKRLFVGVFKRRARIKREFDVVSTKRKKQ